MKKIIAIGVVLVVGPVAAAETIIGPARVVDAESVVVSVATAGRTKDVHVRLKGVDAAQMNSDQGRLARDVMQSIVGKSDLRCVLTGEKTRKREVGFCSTSDGVDINQAIIEKGAALACPRYDDRYVVFEQSKTVASQQRSSNCLRP